LTFADQFNKTPVMATIHITRGTTSQGTFSEEEVREGLRTGRFTSTDLGWKEGMATWEPLSRWPEFATGAPPPSEPKSTIAPTIVGPAADTPAPRSGLPWESRQGRPFFNAFIETLQMVLSRPAVAFTAMRREGGLTDPLLYVLIGGTFGLLVYFLYNFLFQSFGVFANRSNPMAHFGILGIGWIFLLILAPVFIVVGVFINAAIVHLCLMLVGGAKQSFETTFRVICFAAGSVGPLLVVPLCGGLIAGVWRIVLECIGLARAHETDTGRAVLAVFLPLVICCGAGFLLIMLGAFGAASLMSNH
jgi:hypothetical protein